MNLPDPAPAASEPTDDLEGSGAGKRVQALQIAEPAMITALLNANLMTYDAVAARFDAVMTLLAHHIQANGTGRTPDQVIEQMREGILGGSDLG